MMSTLTLVPDMRLRTMSANEAGLRSSGGMLTRSRAQFCAVTTAAAVSTPARAPEDFASVTSSVALARASFGLLLYAV